MKLNSNRGRRRSEPALFESAVSRFICVKCDRLQPESNPSRRISHLHVVPLGHVADTCTFSYKSIKLTAGSDMLALNDDEDDVTELLLLVV